MIYQSFFKALIWSVIILLIGVAQLAVTYLDSFIMIKQQFNISDFLLDGFFLFFAISISSSIIYDFFMDAEIPKSKFWDNFGRYINLILIIIFITVVTGSMLLYSAIYLFKTVKTDFRKSTLITIEQGIFYASFLYAIALKWLIYYHQKIKEVSYDIGLD